MLDSLDVKCCYDSENYLWEFHQNKNELWTWVKRKPKSMRGEFDNVDHSTHSFNIYEECLEDARRKGLDCNPQ